MAATRFLRSSTTTQIALALVLLITFSTGVKVGRHVAFDFTSDPASGNHAITGPHFPYDLGAPVRKLALPGMLEEVSAVSYIDGTRIGMVQDERGSVFIYSLIDARIIDEIPFLPSGDFEGLVVLGRQAWVLRSDGDLYHLSDLQVQNPATRKVETFLKGKDDTEGLTYDAVGRQLLIGLKGVPKLDGVRRPDKRAVYAYQLENDLLVDSPFLLLDMEELKRVYSNQVASAGAEAFNPAKPDYFQPSDLAVHPVTGHIYHIAARGQLLVVSDRRGQIYFVRELPKHTFRQPEGISFDPRGNMFISSEGAGSSAMLLEFRYQPVAKKTEPTESIRNFTTL